jgi:hypothetical protein
MKYAVADIFERQSVISEKRLLAQALHFGFGKVTVEGIKRQLHQKGLLRAQNEKGQSLVTHEKVRQEEIQLISFVKEGLGQFQPLCDNWKIQRKEIATSVEQSAALQHTCKSFNLHVFEIGRISRMLECAGNSALTDGERIWTTR